LLQTVFVFKLTHYYVLRSVMRTYTWSDSDSAPRMRLLAQLFHTRLTAKRAFVVSVFCVFLLPFELYIKWGLAISMQAAPKSDLLANVFLLGIQALIAMTGVLAILSPICALTDRIRTSNPCGHRIIITAVVPVSAILVLLLCLVLYTVLANAWSHVMESRFEHVKQALVQGNLDILDKYCAESEQDWFLSSTGKNLFSYACEHGHEASVTYLLDRGADPNAGNERGITPLMYASMTGRISVVKLLLRYGANVNSVDRNGLTASEWAKVYRQAEVVRFLKEAGSR